MHIYNLLERSSIMSAIFDITKFTMLDYPDELACIVWFSGCNMRCPYCYNPHIVHGKGTISIEDCLYFLRKRQGLLDGVVLSGGECTNYAGLVDFCKKVKALGFLIKIDTNGSRPDQLKILFEQNLVDYMAIDFKATKEKYLAISHLQNGYNLFTESVKLAQEYGVKYEVRTTLHADLLTAEDLTEMGEDLQRLGYLGKFYIQQFIETENLGNLMASHQVVDFSAVQSPIPLELRNF
jgi:pyruvate formate lyase activating enzyme